MARMTLWHRTRRAAAQDIIENGFRDGEGQYLTKNPIPHRGVFVSDEQLNVSDGARGDTLLRIDFEGDEAEIAEFEWPDEYKKSHREWLVPAKLLNDRAQVSIEDIDEEDEFWTKDTTDDLVNRGNAYSKKGEYDRAIADYDKVIALTPNDAKAYYNRGIAYEKKGDKDQAVADFRKALVIDPSNQDTKDGLKRLSVTP